MDLYVLLVFIIFYLTLYFLIFIHELGHLIFAKSAKVLCRTFIIGVGPTIASFRIGETVYRFHLFPFGGGVEMAGEDGSDFDDIQNKKTFIVTNKAGIITKMYINPSTTLKDANQIEGKITAFNLRKMKVKMQTINGEERIFAMSEKTHIYENQDDIQMAPIHRRYWSKSPKKKLAIVFGGPLFNIIAAMITFVILGVFIGTPGQSLKVAKVYENSVSQRAGLKVDDTIVKVNNQNVTTKNDYNNAIEKTEINKSYEITVKRNETEQTLHVQHVKDTSGNESALGFETERNHGVIDGLYYGFTMTTTLIATIILGIKSLFQLDFANLTIGGPLSIFQQSNQVTTTSPYETVVLFIAMMSLNLGIINLFPIPLLDGGRVVNIFIEKLTHRKMSRRAEAIMAIFGIAILIVFIALLTFSDIQKIINR